MAWLQLPWFYKGNIPEILQQRLLFADLCVLHKIKVRIWLLFKPRLRPDWNQVLQYMCTNRRPQFKPMGVHAGDDGDNRDNLDKSCTVTLTYPLFESKGLRYEYPYIIFSYYY